MTLAQTTQADMNWFAVLAHHASRTPDKTITVFEGVATTYGEMADRAAALGGGLSERGVGRGDVVALLSYNCPEFLETSSPPTTSELSRCRSTGASPLRRRGTSLSTPELACSSATSPSWIWPTKRQGASRRR